MLRELLKKLRKIPFKLEQELLQLGAVILAFTCASTRRSMLSILERDELATLVISKSVTQVRNLVADP